MVHRTSITLSTSSCTTFAQAPLTWYSRNRQALSTLVAPSIYSSSLQVHNSSYIIWNSPLVSPHQNNFTILNGSQPDRSRSLVCFIWFMSAEFIVFNCLFVVLTLLEESGPQEQILFDTTIPSL
jgi:hypothetical protein